MRVEGNFRGVMIFASILMLGCWGALLAGSKIYVSEEGDNSNPGSQAAPFRTIEHAMSLLRPGDTLFIRGGSYHEEIVISNLEGTEEAPIVIMAFEGEEVILDGTRSIETGWTLHEGSIYKTTLDRDIWQLFAAEQMLMPARGPNAFLEDESVWDRERNWGHGNAGAAENGTFVDAPHGSVNLAASGIDATDAMAIMNIGSWKTWSRDVLSHLPGSNTFTYGTVPAYKDKHHYYFLEGKLELLDAAGEWYYNKNTRELFVWMPDGNVPSGELRGKVQSFVFNIENSTHVLIRGVNFFATTFYFKNCTHMTMEDGDFRFPSCSKRVLGDHNEPDVTSMYNANANEATRNAFINCSIFYTESQAISFRGHTNLVENCSFYAIDWTVANRPGLMNSIYNDGNSNIFRRNSVELTGASSTLYPGKHPIVELNRITQTGFLQSDGSITQLTIPAQPNSQTRYNWFHNTVKSGARFDAPIPPVVWGHGGSMSHNMVWETNIGMMQKGEYHFCFNNTVLNCENNGIVILDDAFEGGGGSIGSITRNNFSDKLSGHRSEYVKVPGDADHNWNGYTSGSDFREQVYDYANRDFRPRWNSALVDAGTPVDQEEVAYIGIAPDIGAYEFGDSIYWIGGRQLPECTTPIPRNQGRTQYEFVDLMWLEGYHSLSSDVYFGNSEGAVELAVHGSTEFMGNQVRNIFNPGALQEGETYYWRVDAVRTGGITKGDVWSFTAGVDANPEVFTSTFMVYGKKNGVILPLDSVIIKLGARITKTNAEGWASISMLPEGMYKFQLGRKGYSNVSDSAYISSDTLLADTLEFETYQVVFELKDADSGKTIEGGEILFDDQVLITDNAGNASLTDVEYAWYELDASAEGYFPMIKQEVEIFSDTTLFLTLDKKYPRVNMQVNNLSSGFPVNRAHISYADQLILTNSSGEASLGKILVGYLSYLIMHGDYFDLSDSVMIQNDTLLNVDLIPRLASIQFEITDSEGPLSGVEVELDGTLLLYTRSEGIVKFINQQARKDHDFTMKKEGYETVYDSFFLEVDTVISILMLKPSGFTNPGVSDFTIYPNPASDHIFIDAAGVPLQYSITGPDGKVLQNGRISGKMKRIDLSGLPPGTYGARFVSAQDVWSRKIIIQ